MSFFILPAAAATMPDGFLRFFRCFADAGRVARVSEELRELEELKERLRDPIRIASRQLGEARAYSATFRESLCEVYVKQQAPLLKKAKEISQRLRHRTLCNVVYAPMYDRDYKEEVLDILRGDPEAYQVFDRLLYLRWEYHLINTYALASMCGRGNVQKRHDDLISENARATLRIEVLKGKLEREAARRNGTSSSRRR